MIDAGAPAAGYRSSTELHPAQVRLWSVQVKWSLIFVLVNMTPAFKNLLDQ